MMKQIIQTPEMKPIIQTLETLHSINLMKILTLMNRTVRKTGCQNLRFDWINFVEERGLGEREVAMKGKMMKQERKMNKRKLLLKTMLVKMKKTRLTKKTRMTKERKAVTVGVPMVISIARSLDAKEVDLETLILREDMLGIFMRLGKVSSLFCSCFFFPCFQAVSRFCFLFCFCFFIVFFSFVFLQLTPVIAPDVRCPVFPCRGRLLNKEACKKHVEDKHPGKWNDSLVLQHVVPSDPYVRPKNGKDGVLPKSHHAKDHHAVSRNKGNKKRPSGMLARSTVLPLPKPLPPKSSPPRSEMPTLPLPKPLPPKLPIPRPRDTGVRLEIRPGLPPPRRQSTLASGSSSRLSRGKKESSSDLSTRRSLNQSSSQFSNQASSSSKTQLPSSTKRPSSWEMQSSSSRIQLSPPRDHPSSHSKPQYDADNHSSGSPVITAAQDLNEEQDVNSGQDLSDLSDLSTLGEFSGDEQERTEPAKRSAVSWILQTRLSNQTDYSPLD
ncbi:hypothetical protein C8J56DRAFT_400002 [Mycena floridula]|nr:hypothetical protein C8J56DRAFT_400002 [Mycena floridula]